MPLHLTHDETARIHAAIAAAEPRANAHVAFVAVPVSDRYALYPVVWGALFALVVVGIAAFAWRDISLRNGFVVEAAVFCAVSLILEWRPLKLLIVPAHMKQVRTSAFAHREFAARILASPERRAGVLLFVSLGEHCAELIADREAHARVGQATWDRIFGEFIRRAQGGHVADAAVAAIEACGAALESHSGP